ncbi:MAG TPA: hypothetical protein PKV40_09300, partial [Candidatus Kapabacteria bacterium]|nr:hypothetical protein [Candidatus Kapabacteria bacterium]
MKKNVFIIFAISILLWGCSDKSTTPDGDKPYIIASGTNYFYSRLDCDSLWNKTGDTVKLTMTFSDAQYINGMQYNTFSISGDKEYGTGNAAFLQNSFILNTKFGIPFIDTNVVGDRISGYSVLNNINYNPFNKDTSNNILRDTSIVELLLLKEFMSIMPAMIIQEWSSKVLTDTTINVLGDQEKCKNVVICLNRLIRHKYDWGMKPFKRPSDDPALNEFFINDDKEIYSEKIKMQMIYKEKIGFTEILVSHRTMWGNSYYKW